MIVQFTDQITFRYYVYGKFLVRFFIFWWSSRDNRDRIDRDIERDISMRCVVLLNSCVYFVDMN